MHSPLHQASPHSPPHSALNRACPIFTDHGEQPGRSPQSLVRGICALGLAPPFPESRRVAGGVVIRQRVLAGMQAARKCRILSTGGQIERLLRRNMSARASSIRLRWIQRCIQLIYDDFNVSRPLLTCQWSFNHLFAQRPWFPADRHDQFAYLIATRTCIPVTEAI